MRLKDKVAIITGAGHGMGEAEARLFAQEGARVMAADILGGEAERVAADIRNAGGEAGAAKIDVTSEPQWKALLAKTLAVYGRLDILVNNAGISGSSVGDPDGIDGWNRVIAVNQTSVFLGTKLAAEQMAKSGGGSIVNISSIMGFVGGAGGHPAYCASKGAVRIYSKAAAVRYGPLGIRVNTVHPGPVDNAFQLNVEQKLGAVIGRDGTQFFNEIIPLHRHVRAEEVARSVLFLASEASSFTTGCLLMVDGGMSI